MLTKAQVNHIRSLGDKKERLDKGQYVVDGPRQVAEWLRSPMPLVLLAASENWLLQNSLLFAAHPGLEVIPATDGQLAQCSSLRSPSPAILVAAFPSTSRAADRHRSFLALDDVQDPGNVGTILRIADWFGIPQVFLSPATADPWSPKVISAGMGAHTRVNIFTGPLAPLLAEANVPILAATLGGASVYEYAPPPEAGLIIGNEGAGISGGVLAMSTAQITIPAKGGAESLNAAVSAGILASCLFRH